MTLANYVALKHIVHSSQDASLGIEHYSAYHVTFITIAGIRIGVAFCCWLHKEETFQCTNATLYNTAMLLVW